MKGGHEADISGHVVHLLKSQIKSYKIKAEV